jgi:hypothetical protein
MLRCCVEVHIERTAVSRARNFEQCERRAAHILSMRLQKWIIYTNAVAKDLMA